MDVSEECTPTLLYVEILTRIETQTLCMWWCDAGDGAQGVMHTKKAVPPLSSGSLNLTFHKIRS